MWEDPQNCDGGRWTFTVEKKQRHSSLDAFWLNTVNNFVSNQIMRLYRFCMFDLSCWL